MTGRVHFDVLDGLRGTAALSVLVFHVLEMTTPDFAHNPLRHAHLAVDFFFALSGFVLAHAYDARLAPTATAGRRLDLRGFLVRRLIRLHPMAVVAMLFGLLAYVFDPYAGHRQEIGSTVSWGTLALVLGLSLLLLPSPTLPNRYDETHSLDGPAWTLFQEYLANLAYGLLGNRLSVGVLGLLCASGAAAVMFTALHFGNLSIGWSWDTVWAAFVRLSYPFSAGLLLYRLNLRMRLPQSYLWLSLLLVGIFAAPALGRFDGVYEALCVILVFPVVICFGAGRTEIKGLLGTLCRFTGRLSYPLYIIHYPAIYVFGHWNRHTHPSRLQLWLAGSGVCAGVISAAWLLLTYYDEPLREYLSRKMQARRSQRNVTCSAA